MEKPRNVLTNRNFLLIFLGALVSNIGSLFYSFAVSFWILEISGNDAFLSGVYMAVCGVTFVVLTPFGGVLADRSNQARIMYLCDFAKGLLILLATGFIFFGGENRKLDIAVLFVTGILCNVIAAVFSPASSALFPRVIPRESLQQANSYFSIMNSLQSILGVVLAGLLYSLVPVYALFLIVGVCYLLSGVSECFIQAPPPESSSELSVRGFFSDLAGGFTYLRSNRPLWMMICCFIFVNFFFDPIFSNFLPYFAKTDLAAADYLFKDWLTPEMMTAVFQILMSAGSILFAVILSMRAAGEKLGRSIKRRTLLMSMVAVGFWALYALLRRGLISMNTLLLGYLLVGFCVGMLLSLVNIPIQTAVNRITEPGELGRVNSLINMACQGLIPVASFLAGAVLSGLGSEMLLLICSGGLLLVSVVFLLLKPVNEI